MAFEATAIVSAGSLALLYAGLLLYDPCVSLEPCTVTHFKLTVPPLQKSMIHIMNTVRKRIECRIQWRMKWTILLTFSDLALDEAVKRNDPFCDSEKNGAAECWLAREDKSSIKFGLLPWKGNKSNETQHKYSLILNWQFSFIQHL